MYRIGEFSKIVNAPVKTLRYYDEIDLFKPFEVDVFSGYRYYTDEQIRDFQLILELKETGFTLTEIRDNWNHWNDDLILSQKDRVYLEKIELDKKIRKLDELRLRLKNGVIEENIVEKEIMIRRRK